MGQLKTRKAEMEKKCLRVNMKKIKIVVPGPILDLLILPSNPNLIRPLVKTFCYYDCIGHLGQYVSSLSCGIKNNKIQQRNADLIRQMLC